MTFSNNMVFGFLGAAAAAAFLAACSCFQPTTVPLIVTCSETDALVNVNGRQTASGALTMVRRNQPVFITAAKEGYAPASALVNVKVSTTGWLDILGTPLLLFPVAGIFTPGAFELEKSAVMLHLYPMEAAAHKVIPMSHHYDSATRRGVLTVDIGQRGDAHYAAAYTWALENIGVICSSKQVGLESGQPLPPGAVFVILSEKTNAENQLEITFEVVQ